MHALDLTAAFAGPLSQSSTLKAWGGPFRLQADASGRMTVSK
jgi:hypothetical protein